MDGTEADRSNADFGPYSYFTYETDGTNSGESPSVERGG